MPWVFLQKKTKQARSHTAFLHILPQRWQGCIPVCMQTWPGVALRKQCQHTHPVMTEHQGHASCLISLCIIIQYCYYSNTATNLFSWSDTYLLFCICLIHTDLSKYFSFQKWVLRASLLQILCTESGHPRTGSLGLFFSIPTSEENRHLTATDLMYSLCIFLSFSVTELLIFHTFLLFTAIHLQAKHRKTQENSLQTKARSATKDLIAKLCF